VSPRVVVWGELLWDRFVDGARLGGAAANAAFHLRCLGAEVALVSRVGADDLGDAARRRLGELGIDVSTVQVDANAPTGVVDVEIVDGEPRYTLASSAAWDRIELDTSVRARLLDADALVFGTLAQRTELGRGALGAALDELPPTALRFCDANLRPPFDSRAVIARSLARADVAKLNQREATLAARALDVDDAAAALVARGARCVVITRGADGATAFTAAERRDVPASPLHSNDGDAVGAGDAFTAVLTLGCLSRAPLEPLLGAAADYAAFVASERGGMPEPPRALVSAVRRRLGY
jgi:fructokinase